MYVEKDYVLRLIHEIIRMLFKLLTGKDIEAEKEIPLSSENRNIYNELIRMIDTGDIDLAENTLTECLNLMEILTKEVQ